MDCISKSNLCFALSSRLALLNDRYFSACSKFGQSSSPAKALSARISEVQFFLDLLEEV